MNSWYEVDRNTAHLAQGFDVVAPTRSQQVDDCIWSEGGSDVAIPSRLTDRLVVDERVRGCIRCGHDLDIETLKQGAGPELG